MIKKMIKIILIKYELNTRSQIIMIIYEIFRMRELRKLDFSNYYFFAVFISQC